MCSDNKPEQANSYYRSHYSHIAEGFFLTSVVSDDMGDYSKAGKNKNIYFWVSEEPEQVLV